MWHIDQEALRRQLQEAEAAEQSRKQIAEEKKKAEDCIVATTFPFSLSLSLPLSLLFPLPLPFVSELDNSVAKAGQQDMAQRIEEITSRLERCLLCVPLCLRHLHN